MKRSFIIAAVMAIAVVLWLGSGFFQDQVESASSGGEVEASESATDAALTPTDPEAPAPAAARTNVAENNEPVSDKMTVQTAIFRAQQQSRDVVLRGRTDSVRVVQLMAETSGAITNLYAKKGERVSKGDRIARLSVRDREARRLEAVALVEQRRIEHEGAIKLAAKGFRSETAVAAAKAQLDAANAALKRVQVEIGQLTVRAPFDGTISARHVQLGAFLGVGDPVITLVDQDPILVVGNVSEREVGKLNVGDPARAKLVDGRDVTGTIRFIAPSAEAETRTFRVEVEVPNGDGSIRDGITAEIRLSAGKTAAHLLSPAILTLNTEGEVGVRTVDSNGVARFQPVTILTDSVEGVWVTGLPTQVEVITVGQEFVQEGQTVAVARATD